jgi:hypothetical protein
MLYVIRAGFTVVKNGLLYTGGQSVDLTNAEYLLHKHKFEGSIDPPLPLNNGSSNNPSNSRIAISTIVLATDKQLENTDAAIQVLTNSGSTVLNILLPSEPNIGRSFLIISEANSVGNFLVNGTIIYQGDRYEIIWSGDRWVEL